MVSASTCGLLLADVGVLQDAQTLGVGGHDAVFDSVVDHLDEVAGSVRTAMQVALFGGAAQLLASGRARDVAAPGRKRGENGIEVLDHIRFAADHHAIAAFQAPDAAAGANVDVMDFPAREFLGAANVVDVVGVAAVDEDVAGFRWGSKFGDGLQSTAAAGTISQMARGFSSLLTKSASEAAADRPSLEPARCTGFGERSKTTHWCPPLQEAPHHICAHPSKTNHSELHTVVAPLSRSPCAVLPKAHTLASRPAVMMFL